MFSRTSVASVLLSAALVCACTTQERTISVDGVEVRAGRGELTFTERHEIDLAARRDVDAFREWTAQQGFSLDVALYQIGYLGPPPSACAESCDVLMLHVGHQSRGGFTENYLIYAVDGSIVRIDNAFDYAAG